MKKLVNKTAIITGSAKGIGKSIAVKFSHNGANIIIADIIPGEIENTVSQLKKTNENIMGIECNVTDENQVTNLVKKTIDKFNSIDILVNNAGITNDKLFMRMHQNNWKRVLDVNLTGTFLCTQKISRIMIKQRQGKILNLASIIGIIGNVGQANYAASKGGIIAFTKSIAKELAPRNINVNAIAPGFINTEMTDKLPKQIKDEYLSKIPMKRFGEKEDIANLALFLCSQESNYITGQTIIIDGGII